MNPMTNVKNIKKLSELELKRNSKSSWHDQYKDSAWIFVGGLPYDLTEGDVICVFSQYGEVVNLNLVRDKATGKSKGFCFLCYEDQRSTVLAVDNLNGIKLLGRIIRVDHVADYKPPKDSDKLDDDTRRLHEEGCAPGARNPAEPKQEVTDDDVKSKQVKKDKKEKLKARGRKEREKERKKKKRKKKRKKQVSSSESSSSSEETDSESESESVSDSSSSSSHSSRKRRQKKDGRKKKKRKKKKPAPSESTSEDEAVDSQEKRRRLVEKIKSLQAVLKAAKKSEETANKDRQDEPQSKHHDGHRERQESSRDRPNSQHHENGTTVEKRSSHSEDRKRERTSEHNDERYRKVEHFRQEHSHDRDSRGVRDTNTRERNTRERRKDGSDKSYDRNQERYRR